LPIPPVSLAWKFIPNAGGQAAVGRAVMLEPFLRHIFSVFDNSRQISTSAVRDHTVWNLEGVVTDRAGRMTMPIPERTAGSPINLAARNFASISATADNRYRR
jgi:hypothetical protein